jgi:hypothetical protein
MASDATLQRHPCPYLGGDVFLSRGRWKVESGTVESGRWKVEGGKWKVESGRWKVESGTVESGRWKVEGGKWKVEGGRWNGGKWKVDGGKWKALSFHVPRPSFHGLLQSYEEGDE